MTKVWMCVFMLMSGMAKVPQHSPQFATKEACEVYRKEMMSLHDDIKVKPCFEVVVVNSK